MKRLLSSWDLRRCQLEVTILQRVVVSPQKQLVKAVANLANAAAAKMTCAPKLVHACLPSVPSTLHSSDYRCRTGRRHRACAGLMNQL